MQGWLPGPLPGMSGRQELDTRFGAMLFREFHDACLANSYCKRRHGHDQGLLMGLIWAISIRELLNGISDAEGYESGHQEEVTLLLGDVFFS